MQKKDQGWSQGQRCDAAQVKRESEGRWPEILSTVGRIPSELLDGKHHECPRCGGKDRFRFIDERAGAVYCNQCFNRENGDGISAVRWARGWDFKQTIAEIAQHLGLVDRDVVSTSPDDKRRTGSGKPSTRYVTASAAVKSLEQEWGRRSTQWTYCDIHGEPVGVVVRWDTPGGKVIRPLSRHGDGWIVGGMPEPRPLYGLPDLTDADVVFVVEGEKCADALASVGLTATTSPHGSNSASKADWSPLAGKCVAMLPDNDDAGRRYVESVAGILARLTPPARVKLVDLPDLPPSGDAHDWLESHDAIEPDALREQIENLADTAEEFHADQPWPEIVSFDDLSLPEFPTHALPDALRDWVEAESHATQTPADLAAMLCGLLRDDRPTRSRRGTPGMA